MTIGNMNSLPWYLRLGIFAVLALSLYGGFWYLVTRGTRKETRDLQDQISVLQKANAEAQIASQRLNEFRTAYKNKQEELEELLLFKKSETWNLPKWKLIQLSEVLLF